MSDRLVLVGNVVSAHGLTGELKVYPTTDFPEERFAPGADIYLNDESHPVIITRCRSQQKFLLITLKSVNTREKAQSLKGSQLLAEREDGISLPEQTYWIDDLVGCAVIHVGTKEIIGTIAEVLEYPANDVYVVRADSDGRSILIPAIHEIVVEVDIEARSVGILPIDGLLD